MPPNMWLFLQGFKGSHLFFFPNWFIGENTEPLSEAPDKAMAIFGDSNFIRITGHDICILLVVLGVLCILFLCKFGIESSKDKIVYDGKEL